MNQSMRFQLGEFSSELSIHDNETSLFAISSAPSLLVTDEELWRHLPRLIPGHARSLRELPAVRSESDLSALGTPDGGGNPGFAGLAALVILPAGESAKTLASVELILKTAFRLGFARDSRFIGMGGGAVTDVAAFASSLFMRGNRLLLIPSTLLAMVDAAFGGKTGINYFGFKNMVGSFYPAHQVRVLPELLNTLSDREYLSGLAEVIKSAMLDDGEMFGILESRKHDVLSRDRDLLADLVWRSLMVKGRIVLADLRESGIRAHLNFGHTFAHALESLAGMGSGGTERRWTHGEAVAWGMVRALRLGVVLGCTDGSYADRAEALIRGYGYRLDASGFPADELIAAMKSDKKKQGGAVRFVLQESLCSTFQNEAEDDALRNVLN
jgi:3-dehydroquinate synthase